MPDDAPTVVVNSGPIIALSGIGQLDLLRRLHEHVLVPEAVVREVSELGAGRPGSHDLVQAAWIERVEVSPPPDRLLTEELGIGEAEVITLAVRRSADLVLIDDRRARRIAELAYGLRVQGTAGLLVAAKRRGFVPALRPILDAMRAHGYYLSERLVAWICCEVGEP